MSNLAFKGTVLGHIAGQPIYELAEDESGGSYSFAGVAPRDLAGRPDVDALQPGEWLVAPGLIYRANAAVR